MTETRNITLGDRVFAVPALPLRHNRVVYPLCRDLSAGDDDDTFLARVAAAGGSPEAVRDDEWEKLEQIALHLAMAADSTITRDTFDDMPVTHVQLLDSFFIARLQTQLWFAQDAAGAEKATGEGSGAAAPR